MKTNLNHTLVVIMGILLIIIIACFVPGLLQEAWAVEPICPGGSNPDPNVIFCDDFEDGTWLSNPPWSTSPGYDPEYQEAVKCDNNSFGFNDQCAAYSGILHFDGYWGYDNHYGSYQFPGEYEELYVRAYVYFSNPYTWGSTGDKGIYFRNYLADDAENFSDQLEKIRVEYSRDGQGQPTIASYGLAGEIRYQNQGNDITFQSGKWYLVEFYMKLNTPGQADGVSRVWVDDATGPVQAQTLRLEYTDLDIRKCTEIDGEMVCQSRGYDAVWLTDYHQRCDANCPSTIDQWVKWDNIVVSTEPIGPMAGLRLNPVEDTFLNVDSSVNGSDTELHTYTWPDNQVANAILMKFDLSGIPAGATIQNASLNLYLTEADTMTDNTYTVSAHRVINFDPTINSATGYTYDGSNGWTPNVCCYNNVPLAQADISAAYDTQDIDKTLGYKSWNVTALVQEWMNNPSSNFGLLLNSDASKLRDRYRYFASVDNSDPALHPYLTITYLP